MLFFLLQMTGLLLRHIFNVTFHFSPPLKSSASLRAVHIFIGLHLTISCDPSLFSAADASAWFRVVLVATSAYCCFTGGALLGLAVKTSWRLCAPYLFTSLLEASGYNLLHPCLTVLGPFVRLRRNFPFMWASAASLCSDIGTRIWFLLLSC